jgi:hypothetical protein
MNNNPTPLPQDRKKKRKNSQDETITNSTIQITSATGGTESSSKNLESSFEDSLERDNIPDGELKLENASSMDNSEVSMNLSLKQDSDLSRKGSSENSNFKISRKSEENSISINSEYNSRVQKNSEYVQDFKGCVQTPDEYVQNSNIIREKNDQNTCKFHFEGFEVFSRYVCIQSVADGVVEFTLDETQSLHFVVLNFSKTRLTLEEESALENTFGATSNHVYKFLLASDHDTQELLNQFLGQFPQSYLNEAVSENKLPDFEKWVKHARVVPRRWLEGNTLLRRHLLNSNRQRMLWDNQLPICLKKVVTFFSRQKKHSLDFVEAESQIRSLGFDKLFTDRKWRLKLEKIVHRCNCSFEAKKLSRHPVFYSAFGYILEEELDSADLKGNLQNIHLDEVQYILYRITRKVYTEGKPCILARAYFLTMREDFEKRTGRKLNNHKLAQITKLLTRYGYLTTMTGHNRPTIYDIGRNNPFYEA